MRALVKPFGQRGLKLLNDVPEPDEQDVGPTDVLIKVLTASVCGTDLHIYKSDPTIQDRVADHQTIGHEFCGQVIYAGEQVTKVTVGDYVSSESHIVCGTCKQCQINEKNVCEETILVGIDRPGGLADYVILPEDNAKLKPDRVSIEIAAMMDAFGNAVDLTAHVPLFGNTVLVTGCGPQGLMTIALALAAGARKVIATEVADVRIAKAKEIVTLHANPNQQRRDVILKATDPELLDEIYRHMDGEKVDVFLETSGAQSAIRDGFAVLRNGGAAGILGIPSKRIKLDWAELVFKGVTVYYRHGRKLDETWVKAFGMLDFEAAKLDSLIYPKYFTLQDYEEAFDLLLAGEAAKVVFKINDFA